MPTPQARLRRSRLRWLVWIAAIALLGYGGWRLRRAQAEQPTAVQTVRVQRKSVRDFVTSVAAGGVAGKQEATLRAEIAATVRKVHHRRGDKVHAGEPLVSYDAEELKERLRLALAAVAITQAQVSGQLDVDAMVAFGAAFVVGVISGVVPARRAAKLDPVEALRYE